MRARLLIFALITIAGCSAQTAAGGAEYVLRESAIDGPSRLALSGPTTLHATNIGEFSHTLVVTDDRGQVIGATGLVAAGDEATLEVDLAAGTYVFSCRIVAEDNEGNLLDHYELGMHRTVNVGS